MEVSSDASIVSTSRPAANYITNLLIEFYLSIITTKPVIQST